MKTALILCICVFLSACGTGTGPTVTGTSPAQAGFGFLPEKAEKGQLFQYYQAGSSSKWRSNWTSPLDLTGVSWNNPCTATLIAPSYVVMAAHFIRQPSVPVIFHDKSGNRHERFLGPVRILNVGDVAIAKLNRPLPPEIKCYRFASPGDVTVGRPAIVSDQTMTLSIHRIAAVPGPVVQFDYFTNLNPIYRRNLVAGDSGNPSFLLVNGDLRLLETHTTGGPGAGPNYGDPAVQAAIRATMSELGN